MKFWKIQGAGNDFIILDQKDVNLDLEKVPAVVKDVCTRKVSLGADGLMLVDKAKGDGDFFMHFYNSNGTVGEMCGNGARCIARYAVENGLSNEDKILFETTAGLIRAEKVDEVSYKVKLNEMVNTQLNEEAWIGEEVYPYSYVELGDPGVPHLVTEDFFSNDEEAFRIAKALRSYNKLEKGANVNLYKLLSNNKISLRTFERGVEDFTLACGTGAGSTVALLWSKGLLKEKEVEVVMPGGCLTINLEVEDGDNGGSKVKKIFLTGPTKVVAKGDLYL